MICFWDALISFLELTADAVSKWSPSGSEGERLTQDLKLEIEKKKWDTMTDQLRCKELVHFSCCIMPTSNIRGEICVNSEKAVMVALNSEDCTKDGSLEQALILHTSVLPN